MALRAAVLALLLAVVVAVAGPVVAAEAVDGCEASTACIAGDGEHAAVPCLVDHRCGGAAASASGAVVLLAVAVAVPRLPALVGRRHDVVAPAASPALLLCDRLLRPPQLLLPS